MKYIRTESGIWQLDDLDCVHHPYNDMPIHKSYLDIINQANNIEELCDEFVYVDEEIKQFLISDDLDMYKAKQLKVFGAIWTDKGLIYVAKMNEKGELELL